jgi:hypothetical protein
MNASREIAVGTGKDDAGKGPLDDAKMSMATDSS